jgi:hypothetical protein
VKDGSESEVKNENKGWWLLDAYLVLVSLLFALISYK